ncbi:pro-neuropeptide Y [Nilaparvata lugens]|uniref:Neuropeptide F n=1 Tax=Nilaparvata lugens TaxID=108931 RepID=U3U7D6_NILLU|nr:pro-neuropeptide Y [Nilaparvata lugens]XP_022186601.1 pro-neuropeptide Y [Nilaparvata lugens]BAO00965.1 neuropeptide F [Nilaparvata lugens]
MLTLKTALLLVCCVLLWAWPSYCDSIGADSRMHASNPRQFQSPEDLRSYLDQLQLYYAVAGRPRFGKRVGYNGRPSSWVPSQDSPVDDQLEQIYSFREK